MMKTAKRIGENKIKKDFYLIMNPLANNDKWNNNGNNHDKGDTRTLDQSTTKPKQTKITDEIKWDAFR